MSWSRKDGRWLKPTQRKSAVVVDDEAALTVAIIALALQYERYGYRRITALLGATAGR